MSGIFYAEVANFYAAIEQAENAALRGQPVIVGGDPSKKGLVQSASVEALGAGVEVGMAASLALRRCSGAHALRTDMKHYREVSERLRTSLWSEVASLEKAGLGAFYFEGSAVDGRMNAAGHVAFARRLQRRVGESLSLPLRVGVGPVKFLAKLAAEEAGPDGVLQIRSGEVAGFLGPLSVGRLPGVGPKTRATFQERLGVCTVADLLGIAEPEVADVLGNHGLRVLEYARGHDDAGVRAARHPQSMSSEHTFPDLELDWSELLETVQTLARSLADKLSRQGLQAECVAVRVRFGDGASETRSQTLARSVFFAEAVARVAEGLLARTRASRESVHRLGLSVSKLSRKGATDRQLELFPDSN